MAPHEILRSRSNPLVKRMRAVRAGKHPDSVLLEGQRLVSDALHCGLELEALLVAAEAFERSPLAGHPLARPADRAVLEAVSDLSTPPDHVALASAPRVSPVETLAPAPRDLLVVLADVADPGNLGACARVAEAGGARALGLAGAGASPAGSKALRGSMGSLLRLPLVRVESATQLSALGWRSVVAATRGGRPLDSFDWDGPLAIWMTGETGRAQVDGPTESVTIPMAGAAESLNVAVATALLVFAAGRV